MRILGVEDEAKVARTLKEGLEREHDQVTIISSGGQGFYLATLNLLTSSFLISCCRAAMDLKF